MFTLKVFVGTLFIYGCIIYSLSEPPCSDPCPFIDWFTSANMVWKFQKNNVKKILANNKIHSFCKYLSIDLFKMTRFEIVVDRLKRTGKNILFVKSYILINRSLLEFENNVQSDVWKDVKQYRENRENPKAEVSVPAITTHWFSLCWNFDLRKVV